ncbi:hypothetical protein Ndes2437B_g08485 [Nannochloris sp. 'desiccata']
MKGFMFEDVQLALHSELQPLQSSFPAPELSISAKSVLKVCLEQQLQENVKLAQRLGLLPDDEELSILPVFQQARKDDAHHIQRSEKEAAAREENRRLAVEEAKRAEGERQRRAAEEAAAEAERKKQAKEARRQARLEAKKESLKRACAEEQRRYDELLCRWKLNVEERQTKHEEVKRAIATASEQKASVQRRLAELIENKSSLLKQLRDLAARGTGETGGESRAINTAEEVGTGARAGALAPAGDGGKLSDLGDGGGRDRDLHRSHLKRPREHQSSYHSYHSIPPGKFPREGSYERIDREREIRDREYPPLGLPAASTGGPPPGRGGRGNYSSHSRYSSYNERHGREIYGGSERERGGGGGGSGYIRHNLSPERPAAAAEEREGWYMHHHHRGGGGGGGRGDRGHPSRDEIDARDRERERGGGGYHRQERDEQRNRAGGPVERRDRPWQERR